MSGVTPLYALAEKQDGRRFLCDLQKLQPAYFYRIPISAWAQPSLESSGKPPAFWWLTADKNTTAMLYDWQRMNPDCFYRVSASMWSKAPVSGKYQGVTALYHLVANGGIKILSRMLAQNRHFFSCLTTNAWSKISDIFKASAFLACSGKESGRRLLYHWQKSDPASFYALPLSVWSTVINSDPPGYSPIFCFATCPKYGIKILISLIEQRPELFNEIPLHVWYKTVSVRCDNFGNSAFFELCVHEVGKVMLRQWQQLQPDSFYQLPLSVLQQFTRVDGSTSRTALSYLCESDKGVEILTFWLKSNYHKFISIPKQVWKQEASDDESSSALLLLTERLSGKASPLFAWLYHSWR